MALRHYLSRDAVGWVEGLTGLKEQDKATTLLVDVPDSTRKPPAPEGEAGANGTEPPGPDGSAGDGQPLLAADLSSVLEETLLCGEQLLSLGAEGVGPELRSAAELDAAVAEVQAAAEQAGVDATVLLRRAPEDAEATGRFGAEMLVRRRASAGPPVEVRVSVIGNVDSGKSTLVGCLTRSMKDDGRGLARSKVFKHSHEETTGRTSSIGQHNFCLDSKGNVLNDAGFKTQTSANYVARASKCITLIDLAGHERYFKTTAYGLTAHLPDYSCLVLGANAGLVGMSKEHLGVTLALRVPTFFLITKTDICPGHILEHTIETLTSILRKPGVRKKPVLIKTVSDTITAVKTMQSANLAPIFLTSSVTGDGLQLVRLFFNLLPLRQRWTDRVNDSTEFVIDETFSVQGVGVVVAGTLKRGQISTGSSLLLGPDPADGQFRPTVVKSICTKRLMVPKVTAGSSAALALKRVKRASVRKGQVLVDAALKPASCWEFSADCAILTHSTTIQPRYQAVLHLEVVRQAARVVAMDRERLRSGDRALVRFRFLQRPEFLQAGTRFVFREGRTKGIGLVVETHLGS